MNLGPHLLVQVNQGLVRQLEGLDGLQDGVPVAAVYVGHEALDAVHRVQRHRGLLLQTEQGPLQVVLLEVLHDQTDHAGEETGHAVTLSYCAPDLWNELPEDLKSAQTARTFKSGLKKYCAL